MTGEIFDKMVKATFAKCRRIMNSRKGVYAPGADRLSNFKCAAELQNITQLNAVLGMMSKHVVAIGDMAGIENASGELFSLEQWDEKIIDNINYLLFLRAAIVERSANGN